MARGDKTLILGQTWPTDSYRSGDIERWGKGEIRTVDKATADYLQATFPEYFVEVKTPKSTTGG